MEFKMIFKCKTCSTPVTKNLIKKYPSLKSMIKTIQIMSDEEIAEIVSEHGADYLTDYDTHTDIVLDDGYSKESHCIRIFGKLGARHTSYKAEVPKMYIYVSPDNISEELKHNLDNKEYRGCCGLDNSPLVCTCGELLGDIDTDCWKLPLLNIRVNKVYR